MALRPDLSEHAAATETAAIRDLLLLSAWRKIVVGQADCPVLARELGAACGADAGTTYGAIMAFLTALAYAGRRRLRVGYPGCPGLTRDERQLLDLISAAQHGAAMVVEANLRWLTHYDLRPAALTATAALAAELTRHGLTLGTGVASAIPERPCAPCLCADAASAEARPAVAP